MMKLVKRNKIATLRANHMNPRKAHEMKLNQLLVEYEMKKRELEDMKHHKYLIVHIIKLSRSLKKLRKEYVSKWTAYAKSGNLNVNLFESKVKSY